MEQRLSLITLGVAHLGRSRRFYEALGWRASGASQTDVTFFQLGGIALSLWGRAELAKDAELRDAGVGAVWRSRTTPARARSTRSWRSAGSRRACRRPDTFWGGCGVFRRPGRPRVGSRLEPALPAPARRSLGCPTMRADVVAHAASGRKGPGQRPRREPPSSSTAPTVRTGSARGLTRREGEIARRGVPALHDRRRNSERASGWSRSPAPS
jgi:hypothetical protein